MKRKTEKNQKKSSNQLVFSKSSTVKKFLLSEWYTEWLLKNIYNINTWQSLTKWPFIYDARKISKKFRFPLPHIHNHLILVLPHIHNHLIYNRHLLRSYRLPPNKNFPHFFPKILPIQLYNAFFIFYYFFSNSVSLHFRLFMELVNGWPLLQS